MAAGRTISVLRTTVIFGLVGPLVPAIGLWGAAMAGVDKTAAASPAPLPFLLLVMLFSYFLGGPAALITGLVGALVSTRLARPLAWIGACVGIGVVASFAVMFLYGQAEPQDYFNWIWLYLAGGAAASAVCAFLTLRLRPKAEPGPDPVTEHDPQEPS